MICRIVISGFCRMMAVCCKAERGSVDVMTWPPAGRS